MALGMTGRSQNQPLALRCPTSAFGSQAVDQSQDFREQSPWNHDLGKLERDMSSVLDHRHLGKSRIQLASFSKFNGGELTWLKP